MPGGSKKGGGLEYVPFKMKGSPMKRNFGIGEKESPDKESPLNQIESGHQQRTSSGYTRSRQETAFGMDDKKGAKKLNTSVWNYRKMKKDYERKQGSSSSSSTSSTLQDLVKKIIPSKSNKTPSKSNKRKKKVNTGTFNEAFKAARKAHGGPGGEFEYKGKKYTTNYANE